MRDVSESATLVAAHMRQVAKGMHTSLVASVPMLRAHLLKFNETNEDGSVFLPSSIVLPPH
jgi:hypothetical protein